MKKHIDITSDTVQKVLEMYYDWAQFRPSNYFVRLSEIHRDKTGEVIIQEFLEYLNQNQLK